MRPSEIEIGMPVSISANSKPEDQDALFIAVSSFDGSQRIVVHALDVGDVMVR